MTPSCMSDQKQTELLDMLMHSCNATARTAQEFMDKVLELQDKKYTGDAQLVKRMPTCLPEQQTSANVVFHAHHAAGRV